MGALQGKAVVITGAGRGIGAACAKAVARRGAAVVVNDIDAPAAQGVAQDIRDAGGRAVAQPADVSLWSDAARLIERCIGEFGAIDGLVNNAGVFSIGRLDELAEQDIRDVIEVNLVGAINCAAHAARAMRPRAQGSIVNVVSGSQMGVPALGVYGATNGAVATLTYAWAMELKDQNVRVNAFSPLSSSGPHDIRDAYRSARGMAPLGAPRTPPENNAPVVEFLLSDASAGVTGQVVRIDGPQLGLCTHPGILTPLLHSERWTFESVCEAFEQDLSKRQVPTGIVGMEITTSPNPSAFWNNVPKSP